MRYALTLLPALVLAACATTTLPDGTVQTRADLEAIQAAVPVVLALLDAAQQQAEYWQDYRERAEAGGDAREAARAERRAEQAAAQAERLAALLALYRSALAQPAPD